MLITGVVTFAIAYALASYVVCPAVNFRDVQFYCVLIFSVIASSVGIFVRRAIIVARERRVYISFDNSEFKIIGVIIGSLVVILVLLVVVSSPIFNARVYRDRIVINTQDEEKFATEIPLVSDINKIALMDTESAKMLGDRVLGGLSDVVSQFEIYDYYTIEINGSPMKIASLEYGNFFKWVSNRDKGIPGYVLVDPITSEAKYVKVEGGMKYAPSGFLSDDLIRHLRSKYPTKLFGDYSFQVDNKGNVYWVMSTVKPKTAIGCKIPNGAIVCNAVTGECDYYDLECIPDWVDLIFNGETVSRMYDEHGRYINGFINFSKKGITQTTDDYGYLCMGSDIYIYTGITSASSDESNLGFILVNSRTGVYNYYAIAGAEEYSAMNAAQGAVQNYGYNASFPSLVNVGGIPTYVMVLKDSNNLVKMYAMVNVENYTIVSCENTLNECLKNYNIALKNAGTSAKINNDNKETSKVTITVEDIKYITIEGNTFVYVLGDNGKLYRQIFTADETIMKANVGDMMTIEYVNEDSVTEIEKFSIEKAPNVPNEQE